MSELTIKDLHANVLGADDDELLKKIGYQRFIIDRYKKPGRVLTKSMAIDSIFQDLETTYDKDGKMVDTRFNKETQAYIKNFLQEKHKKYDDYGYQSLRYACYSLNKKDRLELCRNLNERLHKNIDIDKRLKGTGFFEGIKNKVKIVTGGATLGIQALKFNYVLNKENKNLRLRKGSEEAIKAFTEDNVLSKAFPINLALFATVGLVSGALGAVVTSAYNLIKNLVTKASISIKNRKFIELDTELHEGENMVEAERYGREIMGYEAVAGKSR